ncbi:MAG: nitrous oxide reductase family maturation protein NosD [Gemmatimonadaceae bacterium]|nr:nitrous oxide reductase family maturation protein NosD [Gemmatimonadaceae bacterium]MCW5825735.1 nitrous oxide reductase family maturation protein NosD [Gemmatimonadaceae bacterium]
MRALRLLALGAAVAPAMPAQELVVGAGARYTTVTAALAAAAPGATIRVRAGTYREATLVIRTDGVTLQGEPGAIFDGQGQRELVEIRADDVTVRGFAFTNTGVAHMEDRSALRVVEAARCIVAENQFTESLFAIYLQRALDCVVRDNDIRGGGAGESSNGNGIHLWHSTGIQVLRNRVRGQRDGIYFEFSRGAVAEDNISEENARYGLHFMFSDSCRYARNAFVRNGAGVAVMYSRAIEMERNDFRDATGSAAYALLLKEITDGRLVGNRFVGSSTGLYLEGASRLEITGNEFRGNGWAVRLMADALDNHFTANRFVGNAFDVATNSRTVRSTFEGNWWDGYRGYDLDRDGRGDVPFRPVRFFALVVEKHPAALLMLRSPVTVVLDAAERVFPVLTPPLADTAPLMRPPQ